MVHIDDARELVLSRCAALDVQSVAIADAVGCVLAREVTASEAVPPFHNSAVDGYAVRAADTERATPQSPVVLSVVGEIAAGDPPAGSVGVAQAIRIMTGAPMPEGADAVVMVEDTRARGERSDFGGSAAVAVSRAVGVGDAVRRAGDDIDVGQTVFVAGTEITPAVAGVLASVNCPAPTVVRRPRVAVLSTGDELVDDGSPLQPGQIRESNRTMLVAAVRAAAIDAVDYGVVRDDEATLEAVLRRAADECDAIVTSGGVSMGDYDVVKAVLGRIADMSWMQIAIKPAKPFAFGEIRRTDGGRTPVFGLPGNPVSSMVSFELLARPALRKIAGHPSDRWARPAVVAVADEALARRADGKVHYQRVIAHFAGDGRVHVRSTWAQGSHQLAATAAANALAEIPDGDGIAAGADVNVVLLGL